MNTKLRKLIIDDIKNNTYNNIQEVESITDLDLSDQILQTIYLSKKDIDKIDLYSLSKLIYDNLLTRLAEISSDDDIFELAQVIHGSRPSKLYLRSMKDYLRGRDEGEVPRLFREAFSEIGVRPDIVTEVFDELDALKQAMSWAEPGDLILHLVHLEREPIEAYLSDLGACI